MPAITCSSVVFPQPLGPEQHHLFTRGELKMWNVQNGEAVPVGFHVRFLDVLE